MSDERRILILGTATMTVALGLHGLVQDYFSFLAVRRAARRLQARFFLAPGRRIRSGRSMRLLPRSSGAAIRRPGRTGRCTP